MPIIDVHAHVMDPQYGAFLARQGVFGLMTARHPGGSKDYRPPEAPPPQPPPSVLGPASLEERFAAMDAAGVSRQILSPTSAPYMDDRDTAVEGARLINDIHHRLSTEHPDRFSFYVSMPLPHVQESLDELKRGFDALGAVGATLHTFCLNESVVQDAYEPIWQELNRRKAVVFFHPCQNGLCSHLLNDWGLTVCAGASFEDAVVAMHLIAKQVPVRYPDIKFIVPHFGGPLAMLSNRLDGQMAQAGFAEKPSETVRRMWYDTVGWGSKGALLAAVSTYGEDKIVTGSDWPFLLHYESYTQTFRNLSEAGLSDATVDRILNRNTQQLFGLEK